MRIVVTDWDLGDEEPARGILEPAGYEVEFANCSTAAQVVRAAKGAEALMVRFAKVSRQVFEGLDRLRFVARLGIGPWQVDLASAAEHKVAVADCPKYCTDEAVAHTWALILALNRQLEGARSAAREGQWATYGEGVEIQPLTGLTLGCIGLGRLGRGVARVAEALALDVIAYDPYVLSGPENVELVDLETILTESDIVGLFCPATAETHHLVNKQALAKMRPSACLINTARGGLVDEAALVAALDAGKLAAAALDVLESEPPSPDHPLLHHPKVLLTPHVAHYSEHSQHELKVHAARTIAHYFSGELVSSLLTPDFRRV